MGWRVKVTGDWKLKVTFANGTVSSRAANQFAFSVSSIKEDSIVNTVSSTVQYNARGAIVNYCFSWQESLALWMVGREQ